MGGRGWWRRCCPRERDAAGIRVVAAGVCRTRWRIDSALLLPQQLQCALGEGMRSRQKDESRTHTGTHSHKHSGRIA